MYTFSFERLEVWNKSRLLTKKICLLTQDFPIYENFGLRGQIRRAIISVCSNLAEGSSLKSKKNQAHFYNIVFSGLMETLNQIIMSNDIEYLDDHPLLSSFQKILIIISLVTFYLVNYFSKNIGRNYYGY